MARKKKSLRDKMKEKLRDKTKESHQRAGQTGTFRDYFNDEGKAAPKWWAGKAEHIIDIIPYIAGKHDPKNAEGDPAYVLDLLVHQKVGPLEDKIVCLEQFNEECPICNEMRKRRQENADYDTVIKPLRPSRRSVYNVIVRDGGKQEEKGVQVFEVAHWFMEKHLAKISKDPRNGGYIVFSDPDNGKSISFERSGGVDTTSYDGHRFVDRLDPISDEELESAFCLDDLIDIKSYEEIYEIFHNKKSADSDSGDNEKSIEEPKESPKKSPTKKTKKKLKKFKKLKCPEGGTIGDSIDDYDACGSSCKYTKECEFIADNS